MKISTIIFSCLLLSASIATAGPVIVKDADGNTIGYSLGTDQSAYSINVWVPEASAIVVIANNTNNYSSRFYSLNILGAYPIFFKTTDCSGTPYVHTSLFPKLLNSICFNGVFKTAPSQPESFTPSSFVDSTGMYGSGTNCQCHMTATYGINFQNSFDPLVPLSVNLPFPLPVKLPLQFDFGVPDSSTLQDAIKALQTVSGTRVP